jgi:Fur family ferric uptake transcriptional regulator
MATPDVNRSAEGDSGVGAIRIEEPLCAVFRRRIKAEGQKYTPERAHILDTIIRLDGVFEAERLIDELRRSGFRVSKATVYRTLRLLQDAGIVQRVWVDEEQSHFQLVYGRTPSHLLIDVEADMIEQVDAPGLAEVCERICRERGMELRGVRLQIYASRPV